MGIIIQKEQKSDWYAAENMTRNAFWNLHVPGCDEHYLVHRLRADTAYLPALTRIAVLDKQVIGAIYYSKATVCVGDKKSEILTFGPLCVEPTFQNKGIGGKLLHETMRLAREAGYKGIAIFGEPGYYPKHGFVTCDRFGITTKDGKNFDAFMGIELVPDGLSAVKGKFYVSEIFSNLPVDEVAAYDKSFPYMEKRVLM